MRSFYEKIEEARRAPSLAKAVGKLAEAYALGKPLLERARARCEHHTVQDISNLIQWAAAECAHKLLGAEHPPIGLFIGGGPSTSFGAETRRDKSSLTYRWGKQAELPESWLPTVPLWTRGP